MNKWHYILGLQTSCVALIQKSRQCQIYFLHLQINAENEDEDEEKWELARLHVTSKLKMNNSLRLKKLDICIFENEPRITFGHMPFGLS